MMPLNTKPGAVPSIQLDWITFTGDSGVWTFPPTQKPDEDAAAADVDKADPAEDGEPSVPDG